MTAKEKNYDPRITRGPMLLKFAAQNRGQNGKKGAVELAQHIAEDQDEDIQPQFQLLEGCAVGRVCRIARRDSIRWRGAALRCPPFDEGRQPLRDLP